MADKDIEAIKQELINQRLDAKLSSVNNQLSYFISAFRSYLVHDNNALINFTNHLNIVRDASNIYNSFMSLDGVDLYKFFAPMRDYAKQASEAIDLSTRIISWEKAYDQFKHEKLSLAFLGISRKCRNFIDFLDTFESLDTITEDERYYNHLIGVSESLSRLYKQLEIAEEAHQRFKLNEYQTNSKWDEASYDSGAMWDGGSAEGQEQTMFFEASIEQPLPEKIKSFIIQQVAAQMAEKAHNIDDSLEKLQEAFDKAEVKIAELEQLKEDVESLTDGVMSAGLSKSFTQAKLLKDKHSDIWTFMFFMGLIALPIWGWYVHKILNILTFPNDGDIGKSFIHLIQLAACESPIIWFVWFANLRANQEKRMAEEYEHKRVVASTYMGLKNQIEKIQKESDQHLLEKLIDKFIEANAYNPSQNISAKASSPADLVKDCMNECASVLNKNSEKNKAATPKRVTHNSMAYAFLSAFSSLSNSFIHAIKLSAFCFSRRNPESASSTFFIFIRGNPAAVAS